MPVNVAEKILEELEWKEKCIFRNVSQKCREAVDKKPFRIESIYLKDSDKGTSISIDRESFEYKDKDYKKIVKIEIDEEEEEELDDFHSREKYDYREEDYDEEESDSDEEIEEKIEVYDREECEKQVVQMLSIALHNPSLQIGILSFSVKEKTLEDKLNALFKCFNHQLHVESFEYEDHRKSKLKPKEELYFMKYLPHLKPGVLEKIVLTKSNEAVRDLDSNLVKLAKLEQWKQAKYFLTDHKISNNADKVAHFIRVSAFIPGSFKPKQVVDLKNLYSNSPNFFKCQLYGGDLDVKRIRKAVGGEEFPMTDGTTLFVYVNHGSIRFVRYLDSSD